ncbi:transporter substrate-binding domain-containing protein [Chromobacterium violaceum]|nr:transporter substrate-binding domain-containing protein [Chromobacterium violaceum]OQS25444.1 ABC transporter substrate-binding protein [Chromobacterium violaceum]
MACQHAANLQTCRCRPGMAGVLCPCGGKPLRLRIRPAQRRLGGNTKVIYDMRRNIRLLLALLYSTACQAAAIPACPNGPLKIGYYKIGAAYRDGKGYDVDMVRELARRLGCPIANETELPRLRALKMLETGQIDVSASTLATPDRLQYAWIYQYNHAKNMVLLNPAIQARTLATLLEDPALRWGAIRGYHHGPSQDKLLEELNARHKVVIANDEDDLYKMLGNGVVTAVFAQPFSYGRWLRELPNPNQIVVLDLYPETDMVASGLALSKARFSREAAEKWHQELLKMYQDGSLYDIMRRYLNESAARQMMQKPIE